MRTRILTVLLSALAGGCAGPSPYEYAGVIIDRKGVDMAQYRIDLAECRSYAAEVDVAGRTVNTAARGAVVGGAIGAIVGGGDAAARGAGVGAVAGGAKGVASGEREQEQVVKNCIRGRGYRVLN